MSKSRLNTSQQTLWFIAHNGADVVHHGTLEPGIGVETGQPELEIFDNEEGWIARLGALGITQQMEAAE